MTLPCLLFADYFDIARFPLRTAQLFHSHSTAHASSDATPLSLSLHWVGKEVNSTQMADNQQQPGFFTAWEDLTPLDQKYVCPFVPKMF